MAVRRAAEQAAIRVSDSAHRRANARALWLEVVDPSLLTRAGVESVCIGGCCDVHRAVDQHGAGLEGCRFGKLESRDLGDRNHVPRVDLAERGVASGIIAPVIRRPPRPNCRPAWATQRRDRATRGQSHIGLAAALSILLLRRNLQAPTREETIRRYGNLVTAPGERFQYSNLGYGVLDYVVERAAGKKFADAMREEVFLPLGMTHTSIDVAPGLEPHQAIRYTPEGRRIPFYDFDHSGASAVYSSAHDLARFAMFHMKEHLAEQRAILSDAAIDEMQTPTSAADGRAGYGVGWGVSDSARGYRTVSHSGGMPGVATYCTFVPSKRVAVVVLSNSRSPLVSYVQDMIFKILLPERNTEKEPALDATDKSAESPPPESVLPGQWKGKLVTYKKEFPLVLTIKEVGDVHLKLGDQLETLLSGSSYQGGYLRGRFAGELDHEDARGRGYQVQVELKLRDQVLNGPATVTTLPDKYGSSAVTYWVELKTRVAGPREKNRARGRRELVVGFHRCVLRVVVV